MFRYKYSSCCNFDASPLSQDDDLIYFPDFYFLACTSSNNWYASICGRNVLLKWATKSFQVSYCLHSPCTRLTCLPGRISAALERIAGRYTRNPFSSSIRSRNTHEFFLSKYNPHFLIWFMTLAERVSGLDSAGLSMNSVAEKSMVTAQLRSPNCTSLLALANDPLNFSGCLSIYWLSHRAPLVSDPNCNSSISQSLP